MNNDFYVPPILFPLLDLQKKRHLRCCYSNRKCC